MRVLVLLTVLFFLICSGVLHGTYPVQKVDGMLTDDGAQSEYIPESPPPIDSLCLVFAGVDYGGNFNSPQAYPHAKHITNVSVGSYNFPVVTWETGSSWGQQSLFSYWDDMFKFWSYPDSFTTNGGTDTGRPAMVVDSKGNLHFCWHQLGMPDGYEVFYSRAILDTSAGVVMYNIDRPATMLSVTNGQEETFPSLQIFGDTLIMVVSVRRIGSDRNAIAYNYSTDGGNTWAGEALAYDHGGTMSGSWIECTIGVDPNDGDMWTAFNFDISGDGSMDIVALHWDAATNIWTTETAQTAPTTHPYACPAIVVDYNSIPHIIFQENLSNTGGTGGLSGWNGCGPAGTLYYTHRSGGTWHTPVKIDNMVSCIQRNYCAGYPSAGIAMMDDAIYFSITMPETASVDTGAASPFNVHYAEISPYTGAVSYGGKVSDLPWTNDTTNAIYGHTPYNVPADGPGITWCQMVNAAPPSDVYYCHKDTLVAAVEERGDVSSPVPSMLYQNYPNPAYGKTMIRFTVPNNTDISLDIYDISGR
ncbi:T9SS type A sorting domain-containing protein, partial [candidate division WOR-3 bacterium]|nr:T9SS type A sorting domain-containing protein [candidate division WOR-3 bacterium]